MGTAVQRAIDYDNDLYPNALEDPTTKSIRFLRVCQATREDWDGRASAPRRPWWLRPGGGLATQLAGEEAKPGNDQGDSELGANYRSRQLELSDAQRDRRAPLVEHPARVGGAPAVRPGAGRGRRGDATGLRGGLWHCCT